MLFQYNKISEITKIEVSLDCLVFHTKDFIAKFTGRPTEFANLSSLLHEIDKLRYIVTADDVKLQLIELLRDVKWRYIPKRRKSNETT